ncbi:MAG: hypothetical protein U5L95_03680 [Candidatus Saccharibacteria bacterium]|nr:hypothetical protein [Candidatus Saccharibacteria bacterium]
MKAAKEYAAIWGQDGRKIISTLERITGLTFTDQEIEATVFEGISQSHPLKLRASYEMDTKRSTLVHELTHRLCTKENTKFDDPNGDQNTEVHKIIFLVLYDALTELYGEEMAQKEVETTSGYSQSYRDAWDFVLGMSKQERARVFKSLRIA